MGPLPLPIATILLVSALAGTPTSAAAQEERPPAIAAAARADTPPAIAGPGTIVAAAVAGPWAAAVTDAGRLLLLDTVSASKREWPSPAPSIRALSIDPRAAQSSPSPTQAPAILLAAADPDGGSTEILRFDPESGTVTASAKVSGLAVYLLSAPGAGTAIAITRRGGGSASASKNDERWAAGIVDLSESGSGGGLSIDGPVLSAVLSPEGDRLYLGLVNRIRTFVTTPLRSSWMFRSPGRNEYLLPVGRGARIMAGRGTQLALLDPDHLPGRDPVTHAVPDDDAIARIELPFVPEGGAASGDGIDVALIGSSGSRLALVDLEEGKLLGARDIPRAAALLFKDERTAVVVQADGAVSEIPGIGSHRDQKRVASAQPPPRPAAPPAPPPPATKQPPPPVPEEKPAPPPPTAAPQGSAPESEPDSEAAPPNPPPASASPPAPPSPAAVPGKISGRVAGDLALVKSVAFFGPNSILKLQAETKPAPDGSFSVPLPPPGRYRVVILGSEGATLSCSPPFYQIDVGGEGIGGLAFRVNAKIRGMYRP